MMVRYCRSCDTEFQPHVVRCSDCGGELEDQDPDAIADGPPVPVTEEAADDEFLTLATGVSMGKAEVVARKLGEAGIRFRVGASGFSFSFSVRAQDQAATRQILLRARAIPLEPLQDQPAVAETGGPCPACGDPVAAGTSECPSCGLSLSSEAAVCDQCGAELVPPWEPCRQCRTRGPRG